MKWLVEADRVSPSSCLQLSRALVLTPAREGTVVRGTMFLLLAACLQILSEWT